MLGDTILQQVKYHQIYSLMQTITKQQISNIAQSIVKLSKANTQLKNSSNRRIKEEK